MKNENGKLLKIKANSNQNRNETKLYYCSMNSIFLGFSLLYSLLGSVLFLSNPNLFPIFPN